MALVWVYGCTRRSESVRFEYAKRYNSACHCPMMCTLKSDTNITGSVRARIGRP